MTRRIRAPVVAVGALAAAWCVATLAFVLIHSAVSGLTFAGPYSAYFPLDQLRYLAWIREAGLHGLISDPYRAGAAHLYLQPLFLISGLLWRAGLSVQAAYLVWTPVALAVLIWGYWRFIARFLAGSERAAALALSLLFLSPLVPLLDYGGIVNSNGAYYLVTVAGQGAAYWQAWGYLPTIIALGLMPVFVLGLEWLVLRAPRPRVVVVPAAAGLLVAWLHPWGGIELLLIVVGLLALRRGRGPWRELVVVAAALALPLIYYAIIAGSDSAFSLAQLRASGNSPLLYPLVADFGPLLVFGLLAWRRPRDVGEQILVLWPVAALMLYLVLGLNSRGTALEGVTLPLAVVAVRGWRRLRAPHWVGFAALVVAIVPGAFYSAHTFRDTFRDRAVPFALAPGEQRAVDALGRLRGNVLATRYLAPAVPALDGHAGRVTAGAEELFDGGLAAGAVRMLIQSDRIQLVISDCLRERADLSGLLGPLGFQTVRFGCARVYRRGRASR